MSCIAHCMVAYPVDLYLCCVFLLCLLVGMAYCVRLSVCSGHMCAW